MPRQLLVHGDKTFKITVPDGATITFGPFSPPSKGEYRSGGYERERAGTLRIYDGPKTTSNIIACFTGVTDFRTLDLGYAEEVAREEGATLWKSDENGYERDSKQSVRRAWVDDTPRLPARKASTRRTRQ